MQTWSENLPHDIADEIQPDRLEVEIEFHAKQTWDLHTDQDRAEGKHDTVGKGWN